MSIVDLPPGSHYAVLWGIKPDYAGMTQALLRRSQALARCGAPVTILTYEHRDSYAGVRDAFVDDFKDGIGLRNVWEDLRSWDDAMLQATAPSGSADAADWFAPLGDRGRSESGLLRRLRDDEGRILQSDYFREDGTLLVSDRHPGPGVKRRIVTLCDTSGEPLTTWRGVNQLYFSWLDSLPRNPVAWMICDSKTSARSLAQYERDDVVKVHVVHGSHLRAGTGRPHGELSPVRKRVMENLDLWDAVVFLTDEQRRDVEAKLGPHHNLHVIPDGCDVPAKSPTMNRRSTRGVMLASLNTRKQIGHAVTAVLGAGWVRGRPITLDVWGRSQDTPAAKRLGVRRFGRVKMRGYSPTALTEFESASFMLLTSKSEAFGLALVEAMGRGCIPISYETPYGPADIIDDGVNGFLVPYGDVEALTRKVRELASMKPKDLERIRRAAFRRAREFTDFTPRWIRLLNRLWEARQHSRTA